MPAPNDIAGGIERRNHRITLREALPGGAIGREVDLRAAQLDIHQQVRCRLPQQFGRGRRERCRHDAVGKACTSVIRRGGDRRAVAHDIGREAVGLPRNARNVAVGRLVLAVAVGIAQIHRVVLNLLLLERVDRKRQRRQRPGYDPVGQRQLARQGHARFIGPRHRNNNLQTLRGAGRRSNNGIGMERCRRQSSLGKPKQRRRGRIRIECELSGRQIERVGAGHRRPGEVLQLDRLHVPAGPLRRLDRHVEVTEDGLHRHRKRILRRCGYLQIGIGQTELGDVGHGRTALHLRGTQRSRQAGRRARLVVGRIEVEAIAPVLPRLLRIEQTGRLAGRYGSHTDRFVDRPRLLTEESDPALFRPKRSVVAGPYRRTTEGNGVLGRFRIVGRPETVIAARHAPAYHAENTDRTKELFFHNISFRVSQFSHVQNRLQRSKKPISVSSRFIDASSASVMLRNGTRFSPRSSPMSFMIRLPPTMLPR